MVTFTRSHEAFAELQRESPDLFTTDWNHAGVSCAEMLLRLAEKKVKYPILVITAHEHESIKAAIEKFAGNGLNVRFLPKVGPHLPDLLKQTMLRLDLGKPL